MYNFSSETIFKALSELKRVNDKIGGLLCVLSQLPTKIDDNYNYELNVKRLKTILNRVFDFDLKEISGSNDRWFIVFANRWKKSVFELLVKEKINISALSVFFLRREQFERKMSFDEIENEFVKRYNLEEIRKEWFMINRSFSLNYVESDVEKEQREFYKKLDITSGHKAMKFSANSVAKSATEFSSGPQIQPLYSSQETNVCFIFTNKDLSGYYNFASNVVLNLQQMDRPRNRLVIGAPGTGKSRNLKRDAENEFDKGNIERVTFHPAYTYAQFVGCYKPIMKAEEFDLGVSEVISILSDKNRNEQQKYDELYSRFSGIIGLEVISVLVSFCGNNTDFQTRGQDGEAPAYDNQNNKRIGRSLKPYLCLNNIGEISYEYVPGPFIRIYERAIKNPNDNFLLIIEELNRANAPAVFGDVFQLLDRDEEGKSEYPVKTSEDLRKYLKSVGIEKTDELCIPSNMYIWATMNSADQGVQPLDAAFKRRWDMEYVGLYDNTELDDCDIPASPEQDSDSWSTVKWGYFRRALNGYLLKNFRNVHEDRCIGPFFIKGSVIANANDNGKGTEEFKNQFKNKLLMYLYEDVVKMNPKNLFDENYCSTYSMLREGYDNKGLGVFKFSVNVNNDDKQSD